MISKQSADLMKFISYLKIDINNKVIENVIDKEPNYISRFYTPKLVVSSLASRLLMIINNDKFIETNKSLSADTLTVKMLNSGLRLSNPYVYNLAQTVVLESFALIFMIEEDMTLLKFIDSTDVAQIRQNVKYILDNLGSDDRYMSITKDLQNMDVALGYIEAQIPLMKQELKNNGTI